MPGNRAIAYGDDIDYAHIRVDAISDESLGRVGEHLLVAVALLPQFLTEVGITLHHTLQIYPGRALQGTICAHPLRGQGYDRDVPLLPGAFVTAEQGTGFVHMAPGHGEDDFILCREYGISPEETVADDGTYFPWVPLFAGVHVFRAAKPVCEALIAAGGLVRQGSITHSYPHSWRSKAPLIYRATPQWFIRMDGDQAIRARALQAIAETQFVPEAGRNRLSSMVANRPDWCISRQRAWGVPIAVFVEKRTGMLLADPAVMQRVIDAFRQEGADAWYASPAARFLGNDYAAEDYEQVRDIVDVWFESGCTNVFTLLDRGLPWPADLYLEGSDQHRGWFQSSLLEGIGSRDAAPFRAILTHGFTLDEQGRKQSKSLGNVLPPQKVIDEYGADILRLWVMNTDIMEDQRIGREILKQQAELYRRLRNTLRWLLGALSGWEDAEQIEYASMPELERYMLHRLAELDGRVRKAVQSHDWTGVYPDLHAFCSADLSAFYFDIRKDALYCDRPDSLRRRAARTVLDHLHRCLTTWLAPVLVFTAEEAWAARFGEADSVHLQTFPDVPALWHDPALAARWARLRELRREVTTAIEHLRAAGEIGASLQAAVRLGLHPAEAGLLPDTAWQDLAIVSALTVSSGGRLGGGGDQRRGQPRAGQQMRALLARAARGGQRGRASGALPALRRRGGQPAGLRMSRLGTSQSGRTAAGVILAGLVLAADQASKWWILHGLDLPARGQVAVLPPVLDFAMVWNHGVTFGLLQSGRTGQLILIVVAVAIVVGLVVWLRSAQSLATALAIGAVAGGALGNVADRARFGMVVDFVHVHWAGWDPFPFVFNLGDSAIVLGVAALLLESMLPGAAERGQRARLQPPPPKA